MIEVTIKEDGHEVGRIRIELVSVFSTHGVDDYSVEFAADSGGGWVDLKRRVLYGFNTRKYNVLALVDAALSLLQLNEMEMQDEGRPADLARRQCRTWQALPREASDPERDH